MTIRSTSLKKPYQEGIIKMNIETKRIDQKIIYYLKEKVEKQTLTDLNQMIENNIINEEEFHTIEIDMSGINNIDSLRLGEFMRIKKYLQDKNIRFRLINPTERVKFFIETASFEPFLLGDEKY